LQPGIAPYLLTSTAHIHVFTHAQHQALQGLGALAQVAKIKLH